MIYYLLYCLFGTVIFRVVHAYPGLYNCDGLSWIAGSKFGFMGISQFTEGGVHCTIEGLPEKYKPCYTYKVEVVSSDILGHKLVTLGGGTLTGSKTFASKSQSSTCRHSNKALQKRSTYLWKAPNMEGLQKIQKFAALCGNIAQNMYTAKQISVSVDKSANMYPDGCARTCLGDDCEEQVELDII